MSKYVKKPIVIDAVRFIPERQPWPDGVISWTGVNPRDGSYGYIQTLEGKLHVMGGSWIITGVEGERYACKDSIFRATYDPVSTDTRAASLPEVKATIQYEDTGGVTVKLKGYTPTGGWVNCSAWFPSIDEGLCRADDARGQGHG